MLDRLRLTDIVRTTGQTLYRTKHGLLDDYSGPSIQRTGYVCCSAAARPSSLIGFRTTRTSTLMHLPPSIVFSISSSPRSGLFISDADAVHFPYRMAGLSPNLVSDIQEYRGKERRQQVVVDAARQPQAGRGQCHASCRNQHGSPVTHRAPCRPKSAPSAAAMPTASRPTGPACATLWCTPSTSAGTARILLPAPVSARMTPTASSNPMLVSMMSVLSAAVLIRRPSAGRPKDAIAIARTRPYLQASQSQRPAV